MNKEKPTYLASPYTHPDMVVMQQRYKKALAAAAELTNLGRVVYSPIVHCHEMARYHKMPTTWEFWERFDRVMLSVCGSMAVLMLDGWRESVGVTAEIKLAKEMGLPICYLMRAGHKGPARDDMAKAHHHIERALEVLNEERPKQ